MEKTKKAYDEIFKTMNKYKDVIVFDIKDLEMKAEHHLFGVELVERYGFDLDPGTIRNLDWQQLKDNIFIGFWDGKRRTISWSKDGSQPNNEQLLCLQYSTGAYIFGEDYPTELFQKFFLELKSYNPKYTDNHNSSLYFSMDNASKIYNDYDSILKRYYEENKEDFKLRKIKKMKEDLAKLENK